eukprot:TRINITY_DN49019_c0_g1_i1.p1 TRINITY_DN49019_c0_g1~~TRINITY_DN49019_c0_g1_i1.p1  ORF type:complete len:414 (-),score=60.81 TRINITY_DN49019_c0_g1_i1:331-1572(-)
MAAPSLDNLLKNRIQSLKDNSHMVAAQSAGPPSHGQLLGHSHLQPAPHLGGSPPPQWSSPAACGGMPDQVMLQKQQPFVSTPAVPATVSCALTGLSSRYQLSEADIRETFDRWGPLLSVHIYREGTREVGVVVFADRVNAAVAQRQLNGFACTFEGGASGNLIVVLGPPEQLGGQPLSRNGGPSFVPSGNTIPQGGTGCQDASGPMFVGNNGSSAGPAAMPHVVPPPNAVGQAPPSANVVTGPAGAMPKSVAVPGSTQAAGMPFGTPTAGAWNGSDPALANNRHAWSCKIVVQAEQLNFGFPIRQKILGAGNTNVEHIRSQVQCNVQLRGRASGFLEPDIGVESDEPMYLWLFADRTDLGIAGLEMAQDLLQSVYQEHQQWCAQHAPGFPTAVEPTIIPSLGSVLVAATSGTA